MVALVDGLAGGLVATIAMTAFMMALGDDSPPPTALFLAEFVGDGDPEAFAMPGILLHMGYGVVAGAVFALAVPLLDLRARARRVGRRRGAGLMPARADRVGAVSTRHATLGDWGPRIDP